VGGDGTGDRQRHAVSILSDRDLRRALASGEVVCGDIDDDAPFGSRIQPSSIDVNLTTREDGLMGYPSDVHFIDPENPPVMVQREWRRIRGERVYRILPGEFLLASTDECIALGRALVARLDGRSTIGRLGLFVHVSAGYIDPGWGSRQPGGAPITLELFNAAPRSIILRPGMPIGQLVVYRATSTVDVAYGDEQAGSHYGDSLGTVQAASLAPRAEGAPAERVGWTMAPIAGVW
jgi:dCTP deaminase